MGRRVRMRYPWLAVDLREPVLYDGQLFWCSGPMVIASNRPGREPVTVDGWTTNCAECGRLFGFYTMRRADDKPFGFLRRCETHRKRGKPISRERLKATRPEAPEDVARGRLMWRRLMALWSEMAAADRDEKTPTR